MSGEHKQHVHIAAPAARFGVRHFQTMLMAGGSFTIYMLRVNLSVAIVGMTGMDSPSNVTSNATETGQEKARVYDWDETTQGLVLSSFFWGYMITQIPAGVLTQRFGGHRILTWAMFSTSVLSMLLPPCAYLGGWKLVCANRMLQGVTQGFVYPSMFTMMGLWAPAQERSTLAGIILGAQTMGPVVATPLAGVLVSLCGWPSVFYSYGAFGVLYSMFVLQFGADSPLAHKTISAEERAYIVTSLGGPNLKAPTPWRAILRSSPAWAAIATMALQGGVFLAFLTKIPTYLSTVLKFDIKENGLLTALPYFVSWALSFPFSSTCDWLVKRGSINLTNARKIYNSISHVVGGMAMLALGFCTDTTLSVILLTISIGVMSASYPGVQSNFMDLTPNYSGTIFSISNFLSACCGVAGPIVISWIVSEKGSVSQWRTVYCLLAAVMFISNLHFVLCGSAKVQPWNKPTDKKNKSKRDEEEFPEVGEKLASLS
ncbi:putative inorganic phosphate cotransporter isoform X1 [Frankliniella occidentalis]|uniref:Inorganic phosphate cotransporter isoform X1 n=1 Tax=Frankliniella occidentalis TaxID=133901 RepID=A0A6J1SSQ0_FRAOC|nr:putative inorganic phosphate cotransporter isoform X1 [Frankliniella occidentalis]